MTAEHIRMSIELELLRRDAWDLQREQIDREVNQKHYKNHSPGIWDINPSELASFLGLTNG